MRDGGRGDAEFGEAGVEGVAVCGHGSGSTLRGDGVDVTVFVRRAPDDVRLRKR
jgi:hypothetical protein